MIKTVEGITCPLCRSTKHVVLYTRAKGGSILRRKECRSCKTRMFTTEVIQIYSDPKP